MPWTPVLLLVSAAVSYGLYNFFIKLSSDSMNPVLGAVVLQGVSVLLGAAALLYLRLSGEPLAATPRGLTYAALAGLFVGLAEILSFVVFARGLPASVGIPAIVAGGVAVGVLLAVGVLGEALSPVRMLGVGLLLAGIVLLHL